MRTTTINIQASALLGLTPEEYELLRDGVFNSKLTAITSFDAMYFTMLMNDDEYIANFNERFNATDREFINDLAEGDTLLSLLDEPTESDTNNMMCQWYIYHANDAFHALPMNLQRYFNDQLKLALGK